MIKPNSPEQLARDIRSRSICSVQVGCAIKDRHGIVSWGWNSVGSGYGECAEKAAIRRANKKRLRGATLCVAARRMRNEKEINSMPCIECARLIKSVGIKEVWYTLGGGCWGMNRAGDLT